MDGDSGHLGDQPQETDLPPAPKGAKTSLDPKLEQKIRNGDMPNQTPQYLDDKAQLKNPEGMLNAMRESQNWNPDMDNPSMAILVTEVQELKKVMKLVSLTASAILIMIAAGVILYSRTHGEVESGTGPTP